MYLAMNRFKIKVGFEQDFERVWIERDSHLGEVRGFQTFHLMRGATDSESGISLYATHTTWDDEEAFRAWTRSENFRLAHNNAGDNREMYEVHPNFEGFTSVLSEGANL